MLIVLQSAFNHGYNKLPECKHDRLEPAPTVDSPVKKIPASTPYFAVSTLKLVLMSLCTLGFYQFYWFYKNWVLIKEEENLDIMPFWRAVFSILYCYSLFDRIHDSAKALSIKDSLSPGILAIGWIVAKLFWKLPSPFFLAGYLSVFFIMSVQEVVNDINASAAPGHNKNENFTGLNILVLAVGGLFFIGVVFGAFLLEE